MNSSLQTPPSSPRSSRHGTAKRIAALALALLTIALCVRTSHASRTDLQAEAILRGSGIDPGSDMGHSVAIDGDTAVIGARNQDSFTGAAYVFRFNGSGWDEAELHASHPDAMQFGVSCAIDGDVVVVGSGDNEFGNNSGAVYVYRYDGIGWIEEQRLTASDPSLGRFFGWSVAVEGNVILVGSPAWIPGSDGLGFVYMFRYDGSAWLEVEKISAADTSEDDRFGYSVALDGDRMLVAAPGDTEAGAFTGAGYVFDFDGTSWIETQKLLPADASGGDFLSHSVALQDDTLVLGAASDDDLGQNAGAAYVYRFDGSTWSESQKILASNGAGNDRFGLSVALTDDRLVVGSFDHDVTGAVYLYEFDGSSWIESQILTPVDVTDDVDFGFSVAMNEDRVVIGAQAHSNRRGRGYVYAPLRCLDGTASFAGEAPIDLLYVNGDNGGVDRELEVDDRTFLEVTMLRSVAGGSGKFALHADVGAPAGLLQSALPFDVGTTCFPFLASTGASPVIVANNLGRRDQLFESTFYGISTPDPERATTTLHFPALPLGTVLTFQAVIADPGSASVKQVATTNAITVTVVP